MGELSERNKNILWAIIQSYIAFKGPVGSSTVTKRYSLGLSPATVRNTMADLKALGYITQPHTSAGRIPTEKGYRLYVNTLLKEREISINKALLQRLSNRLRFIEKDVNRLIKETSKTLSMFSNYMGIAMSPKADEITLKHIEFIKHKENKLLGVLISKEGIVKDKVIVLEETLSQKQLDKINKYLINELTGLTFREIKAKILTQISQEKTICDKLIANALKLCKDVIAWETEHIYYAGEVSGTTNLPDFATMKQIKEIFRAIEDKHLMVKLLDKMANSEGVQVFIGSENILSEMKEFSMVASTYNDGLRSLGTIGVIGPTRMNYEKVIPIVAFTAKTLTQIFSER
jgi:heat-inducible transcriptional repressor